MNFKDFFKRYKGREKKGFTVVEMIAVVAILAIASTATISVFLAVRNTVVDTGDITAEQFNVSQIEKFIRNELQVASNVDIYNKASTGNLPQYPTSHTLAEGDECIVYDAANKYVYFFRVDDTGAWKERLKLTSVEKVHMVICPVNYKAAQDYQAEVDAGNTAAVNTTEGTKLKMFYEIDAGAFTYTGGMVLNNTKAGKSGNMTWYTSTPPYCADITWDTTDSEGTNNLCVCFHTDVTQE